MKFHTTCKSYTLATGLFYTQNEQDETGYWTSAWYSWDWDTHAGLVLRAVRRSWWLQSWQSFVDVKVCLETPKKLQKIAKFIPLKYDDNRKHDHTTIPQYSRYHFMVYLLLLVVAYCIMKNIKKGHYNGTFYQFLGIANFICIIWEINFSNCISIGEWLQKDFIRKGGIDDKGIFSRE